MAPRGGQLEITLGPKRRKRRRKVGVRGKKRVPHSKRAAISGRKPIHVTLTTLPAVGSLRRRKMYQAVRRALHCSMGWSRWAGRFRVCHISIQGEHLHLLVEAESQLALSRGVQGFKISCARQINGVLGRHGKVFADRYHARELSTPQEVRNALLYVLANWRHHGYARALPGVRLDPYSSAATFSGWVNTPPAIPFEPGHQPLMVWLPKTWLLQTGWQRQGLLDPWQTPG